MSLDIIGGITAIDWKNLFSSEQKFLGISRSYEPEETTRLPQWGRLAQQDHRTAGCDIRLICDRNTTVCQVFDWAIYIYNAYTIILQILLTKYDWIMLHSVVQIVSQIIILISHIVLNVRYSFASIRNFFLHWFSLMFPDAAYLKKRIICMHGFSDKLKRGWSNCLLPSVQTKEPLVIQGHPQIVIENKLIQFLYK